MASKLEAGSVTRSGTMRGAAQENAPAGTTSSTRVDETACTVSSTPSKVALSCPEAAESCSPSSASTVPASAVSASTRVTLATVATGAGTGVTVERMGDVASAPLHACNTPKAHATSAGASHAPAAHGLCCVFCYVSSCGQTV
ncbi:hypothetical protein [Gemmatimonas sp.]|uniref:hypothetical protein n=1 Tax=Gemmatimonas sp. TaxID=1962908 RepID=UPI003DA4210A